MMMYFTIVSLYVLFDNIRTYFTISILLCDLSLCPMIYSTVYIATALECCIYLRLAATPRRRGITVASRPWLCIFIKRGVPVAQSLRDCGCAYLIKWGNSRFATVDVHI